MSDEPNQRDFATLMRLTQAGDESAARELHDRYSKYILFCVRHRIWRKLRPRFDSQDFVQQVWASFFLDRDKMPRLETPDGLIAYLQAMAENKVLHESRRRKSLKNDIAAESPLAEESNHTQFHPASRLPTPSAVAIVREQYDLLVDQQMPGVRDVAELRAVGQTFEEIGEELDINESTARRAIRRLRKRLATDDRLSQIELARHDDEAKAE